MKSTINIALVNLTSGGLSSGYQKYLHTLLPLLRQAKRIGKLTVFMPPGVDLSLAGKYDLHSWPTSDWRSSYKQIKTQLGQLSPDVVFIPTSRWLDCGAIPTVVMVRNMEPLSVPFGGNTLFEGAKNLIRAYITKRTCQHATRVIAVSKYVQDFLVNEWGISQKKIGQVYHGVDFLPPSVNMTPPQVLAESNIGRFIFTAGSIRPARGLEDVIRAMAHPLVRNMQLTLIVGGQPNPGTHKYRECMQSLVNQLDIGSRILWAGQMNDQEMAWCFNRSSAFIMTSRAEACPNIALEAMSHSCTIISTSQPPMPEFFMNVAFYYQPKKPGDLAAKIRMALGASPKQKRERQASARERALDFRWEETAERTIEQCMQAIKSMRL